MNWNAGLQKVFLPTSWRISRPDTHESSTTIDFFHYPHNGGSFMFRCMGWADKVHHHHPGGTYSESKWEWGSATKCKVSATGPAPDRWDSSRVGRKLHTLLRTFSGSSFVDQGWRVQCRGKGMGRCQHQHSGGGVLITLMILERYDQPWFSQSHLSSF